MSRSLIYGNAVVIDGAEISLDQRVDCNEVSMSEMTGGDLGVYYRVGGGGTLFHDKLRNRELEEQHPIEAITNLSGELEVRPSQRLTNSEINTILNA